MERLKAGELKTPKIWYADCHLLNASALSDAEPLRRGKEGLIYLRSSRCMPAHRQPGCCTFLLFFSLLAQAEHYLEHQTPLAASFPEPGLEELR